MRKPRVAAVIALYNGQDYIKQSLVSVIAQTRPVDEIIVVDDGSNDDGANVAREIAGDDPRFKLLSKQNGGQSSARNFGVSNCKCDLIAFLDQDDWWYPRHIEVLAEPFLEKRDRSLGWTYSNLDEFDLHGRLMARNMLNLVPAAHPKASIIECLQRNMMILPSATLISRKAYDAVGGFDERLSGYEDDDLFMRIFMAGHENIYIDRALSAWRIHTDSSSYSARMAKSGMVYANKLLDEWPDNPSRRLYYARDCIAPRFAGVAASAYFTSLKAGSREDFANALSTIDRLGRVLRRKTRMKLSIVRPVMGNFRLAKWLVSIGAHKLLWKH